MSRSVRLADIAARVGLSKMAVSKALRDHPDIAADTRERVKRAAQEMGYIPNLLAQSLTLRRSGTIGVVVPKISHLFYAEALAGIQARATAAGYSVVLAVSEENAERERHHIGTLLSMQVEGLVVAVCQEPADSAIYERVRHLRVPLVFFDRGFGDPGFSSVMMADRRAAEQAVEELIRRGCRRIAHLTAGSHVSNARERRAGYEAVLRRHEMPLRVDWIVERGFSEQDGRSGFEQLYAAGVHPDGLLAVSFPVALGALDAMQAVDPGLADRIQIATFGNSAINRFLRRPFLCIEQPVREMGERAVSLLIEELAHPGGAARHIELPGSSTLITAAPPRQDVHPDRLFPAEAATRAIARRLYEEIRALPIISPHGHADPAWFAEDNPFPDPARLLLIPDHYLLRMLYSHGVPLETLGVQRRDGGEVETDPRRIWRVFAERYHLLRGTPSRIWLDHALHEVFGVTERLSAESAERVYDQIDACLHRPEFRPRALFERFRIEVLATTDSALDSLEHHQHLRRSRWAGRVIPTFRPDPVLDPEYEDFVAGVARLGELTGEDTTCWDGYLRALAVRRGFFKEMGATATDHGHATARTADLDRLTCERLFSAALRGALNPGESELFRAQMLTEMARMSLDDGLVMQIHPGSARNHNRCLFERFGRDIGADIPARTDYVEALRPLLDRFGNEPHLSVILFTLDESTYTRELAPLAGHYPILKLGPPWWFLDSPEGMLRYRRAVTETAGFYNTVGFNDDTRAFPSIPARHDVARRVDCAFLAELVRDHRLEEEEARELAIDLSYGLAKRAYRL